MKNNNLATFSLSVLLNVILLFPLFTQFFHSLDDHNHIVCTDTNTHIHKYKTKCSICDFNYTPFIYDTIAEIVSKISIEFKTPITGSFNYLYTNNYSFSKLLRGPPSYS